MDDALRCTCGHAHLFHAPGGGCDMCACACYEARVRRCFVCWRDLDRDPWPYEGQLCGHCDDYSHGLTA